MTVLFGTGAMILFEGGGASNSEQSFDLQSSFWFSVYSLFAGEPIPGPPKTIGGKIVAVFVMFMGVREWEVWVYGELKKLNCELGCVGESHHHLRLE